MTCKLKINFTRPAIIDPDFIYSIYPTKTFDTDQCKALTDIDGRILDALKAVKEGTEIIFKEDSLDITVVGIGVEVAQYVSRRVKLDVKKTILFDPLFDNNYSA
jgi:hypothetical protein